MSFIISSTSGISSILIDCLFSSSSKISSVNFEIT